MGFSAERESRYLEHMFQWQSNRLRRAVLAAPVLLLLFAGLQALIWNVPYAELLRRPTLLAGVGTLVLLAWLMRRIRRPQTFAWAGIALQTVLCLSCAFLTRPGHGGLALVLPIFIAIPLVTAPLWARRQTVVIGTALAYAAGAYALVHAQSGGTVWMAYGLQAGGAFLVALMMHATVDQARRGYFEAEEELAERARLDSLTSLLNRRHFLELGEVLILRQSRRPQPFAACFLDLDHFKHVNDDFGHRIGDQLLVAVAQCMLPLADDKRVIGRLGGEEFALLLRDSDSAAAERLAQQLRHDIAGLAIGEARVTASVGIAAWEPGESLSDLLHRADLALLEAKRQGRDRVTHWTPDLVSLRPARPLRPAASGSAVSS